MILNVTRITQPAAEPIDPLIEAFNLSLVPAGPKGLKGDLGNAGWAPVLGAELDGARAVFVIVDWVGGEGTKPTETGYIGPEGIVETAAEALDVRGTVGPQGVSITGATVNGSYQLILTLSNGSTLNAGNVRGPAGAQGPSGTLAIGTVTTGAPGSSVIITNAGTASAAILDITIPRGDTGPQGAAATITIGSVTTVAAGTPASVTNSGTANDAVLDFNIPAGADGMGNVSGPASSVTGNLVRFADTTGKLIEDGGTLAANVASAINGATAKTTPANADVFGFLDSAASFVLKKFTWSDLKTALGSVFQATSAKLTTLAGQTWAADRFTYYTSSSAAAIATITSFGRSLVDDADAAAGRATLGAAGTGVANTFSAPQRVSFTTLTYGATVTPDLNNNNAFVLTMTGNPTVANPSNIASAVGQEVLFVFRGAFQPSFGSFYKFPGGTAPTFSGSLNAIGGTVISSTEILMHGAAGYA